MFNRSGFNNIAFNQPNNNHEINKTDSLDIGSVETVAQESQIFGTDILLVAIDTSHTFSAEISTTENWDMFFITNVDIYAETSGLDPPPEEGISLQEESLIEVNINVEDGLDISFGRMVKAGFNSHPFNQPTESYLIHEERASLEIQVADVLEGSLVDDAELVVYISASDDFSLTIDNDQWIDKSLTLEDGLDIDFQDDLSLLAINFTHDQLRVNLSEDINREFIINDIALVNVSEEYQLEVDTSAFDELVVELEEIAIADKEVFVSDDLAISLFETAGLAIELTADDSLLVNVDEVANLLASIEASDNFNLTIDAGEPRVTGSLSYLINGEFKRIDFGFVKVKGNFKPIVQEYILVQGQWKARLK